MSEYTAPTSEPIYGDELDTLVQGIVRDLSGLTGDLVRPRWQPDPPRTPPLDVTWLAVAVTDIRRDYGRQITCSYIAHHEDVDVLVTAYGPRSMNVLTRVESGPRIPHNNAIIEAQGLYFKSSTSIIPIPERINNQWLKRYDITMTFRRRVEVEYDIGCFEDVEVNVQGEHTNSSEV